VETVIRVNDRQRERMVDKIAGALDGDLQGKTIGMLGLSFKPETDDMREAPAIDIVAGLEARGASVRAFDPVAMEAARKTMSNVTMCDDAYEACEEADVVVLMTEWNQFRMLDFERMKSVLAAPVVVDLRNVYEPDRMREAGFRYVSVGR
jgi:UDPglucose 6-dehydrogenase